MSQLSPYLSPSLLYTLKRLTRGLASSRAAARQGFALALTEILNTFVDPVLTTKDVIAIIQDNIHIGSKANRQEQRDYSLGRVFAALVLARSGRLSSVSPDILLSFLTEIFAHAKTHTPIRQVSYEVAVQVLEHLSWKQYDSQAALKKLILSTIQGKVESMNAEQISLALHIRSFYEKHGQELPETGELALHTSIRKPFSSKNIPRLAACLQESTHTHPRIHSVWPQILNMLWEGQGKSSPDSTKTPVERFTEFWNVVVDEHLFAHKSSHLRKFLGFELVQYALSELASKVSMPGEDKKNTSSEYALFVSPLFSRNFLHSFINNLSTKKNLLFPQAHQTKGALIRAARLAPSLTLPIVSALQSEKGHRRFDTRTSTTTVQQLLSHLDFQSVTNYIDTLIETFNNVTVEEALEKFKQQKAEEDSKPVEEKKDNKKKDNKKSSKAEDIVIKVEPTEKELAELAEHHVDNVRGWVIDQLHQLATNKSLPQNIDDPTGFSWRHKIISFFIFYGLFDSTQLPKSKSKSKSTKASKASSVAFEPVALTTPLSTRTRELFATRIEHVLADLFPHAPVVKHDEDSQPKKRAKKEDKETSDEDESEKKAENGDATLREYHALFSASSSSKPWIMVAMNEIDSYQAAGYQMLSPLAEESAEIRASSLSLLTTLRQECERLLTQWEGEETNETTLAFRQRWTKLKSLQPLIAYLLLLQLSEADNANPLLQDIISGYKESLEIKKEDKKSKTPKKKTKVEEAAAAAEGDKPIFIEVLVDLLLSLLVRPSNLYRDLSRSVFAAFAHDLTPSALFTLLNELTKKSKGDGDGDEDDSEDDDDEDDSEDEDDDDDEDDEDERLAEEDNRKRRAQEVAQARKKRKANEITSLAGKDEDDDAKASSDDEEEDEEMIDMDALQDILGGEDEDVEALQQEAGLMDTLDGHLAQMIKLRKEKKNAGKELSQQSLHFKLRVLDLIEVLIKQFPSHPLLLEAFMPLLIAIDITRTKQKEQLPLQQRLMSIFKRLCSNKEHPAVDTAMTRQLLGKLFARAIKTASRETLSLTNSAILYLSNLLLPHKATPLETVNELVSSLQAAQPTFAQLQQLVASLPTKEEKNKSKKSHASSGKEEEKKDKKDKKKEKEEDPVAALEATLSDTAWLLWTWTNKLRYYLSVRHTHLNTKFFTDFANKFPLVAWVWVPILSSLAIAPLPEDSAQAVEFDMSHLPSGAVEDKPAKGKKKAASKASSTSSFLIPFDTTTRSANGFLRNDCFLLLLSVSQHRGLLLNIPACKSYFQVAAPVLAEAVRSNLIYATFPKEEKENKDEESKSEKKEKVIDPEKLKTMSKKALLRLKAREKKKRRALKKKEAEKAAAANKPQPSEAQKQKAFVKMTVQRLKNTIKVANQATLLVSHADASSTGTFSSDSLKTAVTKLPGNIAQPLKGVFHTWFQSADIKGVKLQEEPKVAANPNNKGNKQQKDDKKQQKNHADSHKAKKQKTDKPSSEPSPKKDVKDRNGKKPVVAAKSNKKKD